MNNGQTDVDRLHEVHEGHIQGRGCGKTMLLCHQIAGQLEIDPQDIVVLIPNERGTDYFMPMLLTILQEHEFEVRQVKQNTLHIFQTGTKIEIGSSNRLQKKLRSTNVLVFYED